MIEWHTASERSKEGLYILSTQPPATTTPSYQLHHDNFLSRSTNSNHLPPNIVHLHHHHPNPSHVIVPILAHHSRFSIRRTVSQQKQHQQFFHIIVCVASATHSLGIAPVDTQLLRLARSHAYKVSRRIVAHRSQCTWRARKNLRVQMRRIARSARRAGMGPILCQSNESSAVDALVHPRSH